MKNCYQKVEKHLTCAFDLRSLLHVSILLVLWSDEKLMSRTQSVVLSVLLLREVLHLQM